MTNKPIAAHCDAGCKKEFTITKFRTRKVKNGIEKTFFKCTHCKQEYVTYYASAETLKLQKDMRKLQKSITALTDHSEASLDAHWEKVDILKAMVKQSMDDARAIAEG